MNDSVTGGYDISGGQNPGLQDLPRARDE